MNEKLLIKCETSVFADEVMNVLSTNNIPSRLHDELQDPAVGAYGGSPGIGIYVFEADYDKAKGYIAEIVSSRQKLQPWCPKCGSEDVIVVATKTPGPALLYWIILNHHICSISFILRQIV